MCQVLGNHRKYPLNFCTNRTSSVDSSLVKRMRKENLFLYVALKNVFIFKFTLHPGLAPSHLTSQFHPPSPAPQFFRQGETLPFSSSSHICTEHVRNHNPDI